MNALISDDHCGEFHAMRKLLVMKDKAIANLARKAARGTLEVEDLLRAAREPTLTFADELDELASMMHWPLDPCFPDVPLGTWVTVIGIFCRKGHDGLLEASWETRMLPFVLGLLEELKTDEALCTAIRIAERYGDRLSSSPEQTGRIAAAMNLIAMTRSTHALSETDRRAARDFLHGALTREEAERHRGTIFCALRYFGDETSLPLISSCPSLPPHWEATRRAAVRGIRKSIRRRTTSA